MTDVLTNGGAGYPPDALVFRFLNNNDTGSRFVTTYGVDFYRVALAMLLTLPGLPCLYTGDEVGAEFLPYETTGAIDWEDHYALRDGVKRLVALRREQASLHSRAWTPLEAEPAEPLFAYLRTGAAGEAPALVVLNFSGGAVTAAVSLPADQAGLATGGAMIDLLSGERVAVSATDRPAVEVPGWSARVLVGAAG
jgi:glycosidase